MNRDHLCGAQRILDLERAIGELEGRTFGEALKFSALGFDDQLHVSNGGWKPIHGFKELPGLSDFATELNAATAPVIERYRLILRRELNVRAVALAAKANER